MTDLRIAGFEILEKVGEGGMATVWKARQLSLDRIVAIKVLSSRLACDPRDLDRFQAEAKAAARLKHPGIVQVYDAGTDGGLYYFVMEFVGGYTLGDWVRRKGRLPEREALAVADCVADALGYAWETQRIIHCDIKPDNIMVDTDGTVKVADLGLARTLAAITRVDRPDEVVGTPAYMAPEQVRGDAEQDFRTDIYALGATLYHLLTGHLLFEGQPDQKVLELQISGTVEDPCDQFSGLSNTVCWLMEKLLAKAPDDRYRSWAELRADLQRVQKGIYPLHRLPEGSASTLRRSRHRTISDAHASRPSSPVVYPADEKPRGSRVSGALLAAGVAIAIIGVAWWMVSRPVVSPSPSPLASPSAAPPEPTRPSPPASPHKAHDARDLYAYAQRWEQEHPGDFDRAISYYQQVLREAPDSPEAQNAKEHIRSLQKERAQAIARLLDDLKQQADRLVAEGRLEQAAQVYETYKGPLATETRAARLETADALRKDALEQQRREAESRQRRDKRYEETCERIATTLLSQGISPAQTELAQALSDPELTPHTTSLTRLLDYLTESPRWADEAILKSLRDQIGREVVVQTTTGEKRFTVVQVADGKISGQQRMALGGAEASRDYVLTLADLTLAERLKRLPASPTEAGALMQGLWAFHMREYAVAKANFERVPAPLGKYLVAALDKEAAKVRDQEAEQALAALLKRAGLDPGPFHAETWAQAVRTSRLRLNPSDLAEYRSRYGSTDFARRAASVLVVLDAPPEDARSEVGLRKETADTALPAEDARLDVARRLRQKNPGLAEETVHITMSGSNVSAVIIISSDVTDLSPLASYRSLRRLVCSPVPAEDQGATEPRGRLRDLTPLAGLPLESLYVGLTLVQDLNPLRGMPLRELDLRGTPVVSLAPLAGLSLEWLNVSGTRVREVGPLKGMPIRYLNLARTPVFDFRMLTGMPLESLHLDDTQVRDIGFVVGMPLRTLSLARTSVFSLTSLRDLALRELNVEHTPIKDLSPLRGMSTLQELNVGGTGISDIGPLNGLRLTSLSLAGTGVRDLNALKGMPLTRLNVSGCSLRDGTSLRGLRLVALDISRTGIRDLSFLVDMPLESLNLSGTRPQTLDSLRRLPLKTLRCQDIGNVDLTPLRHTPLEEIWIDVPTPQVLWMLRSLPRLRRINGLPVREFIEQEGERLRELFPPTPPRVPRRW